MNLLSSHFKRGLEANYIEAEEGASFCVEREGEELFLLFQHSHGTQDWIHNLQFHAVPYRAMRPVWQCHGGFLKVWEAAKPYIAQSLTKAIAEGARRVTVIGYSHGAALAVLCHEWVWYHVSFMRDTMTGFGFGCPRVIYGEMPEELRLRWERFYVIRNQEDTVTHLPPAVMGYRHVGNLITLNTEPTLSGIDAHRPENYQSALEKTEVQFDR